MSAGKGDKPRSCFSKVYRDNYDDINWDSSHQGSDFRKLLAKEDQLEDGDQEKRMNKFRIEVIEEGLPSIQEILEVKAKSKSFQTFADFKAFIEHLCLQRGYKQLADTMSWCDEYSHIPTDTARSLVVLLRSFVVRKRKK